MKNSFEISTKSRSSQVLKIKFNDILTQRKRKTTKPLIIPVVGGAVEGTVMELPDESSITVPLNQPLEPGDQIEVSYSYLRDLPLTQRIRPRFS